MPDEPEYHWPWEPTRRAYASGRLRTPTAIRVKGSLGNATNIRLTPASDSIRKVPGTADQRRASPPLYRLPSGPTNAEQKAIFTRESVPGLDTNPIPG